MATTVESPRVDIGALSGDLRLATRYWLTEVLVTIWHQNDRDRSPTVFDAGVPALDEQEKVELTVMLFERLDELDLEFARTLHQTLEQEGVTTWGLPAVHEAIIAGDASDA